MKLELSKKQFRRLLDMAYIGNWVLNSTRGEDRFSDYDDVENVLFTAALKNGLPELADVFAGKVVPSRAFVDGGIHEAIMDYEDTVFFEILAEELALKDMNHEPISSTNYSELIERIDEYIEEFEKNGTDNILLDI